ncbi:hypothetical protein BBP40_010901 [Aspergillus hancockii]|nr:hypothetical protein BBP40_010901 [Aspergillus hancockii]
MLETSGEHPGLTNEVAVIVMPLLAIAGYNAFELFFWIFDFFRRYRGCYFYSVLVATLGVLIFVICAILQIFDLAPPAVAHGLLPLGIITMSAGSAMVLYARIHLVTSGRIPQFVLGIIIITTCAFHIPLFTLLYIGAFSPKGPQMSPIYQRFENTVITVMCVRELIVSGIYVWAAVRNLKPVLMVKGREGRRVVNNLIAVNIVVVAFNVLLLVQVYMHRQLVKMGCGALTHSIKLKMEFTVLNKLVTLVQSSPHLNQAPALRLSSDNYPLPLSDRDQPSDTSRPSRSTQDDSYRDYVAREVSSPPHALSYDRLRRNSPERTDVLPGGGRLRSPWRGRR